MCSQVVPAENQAWNANVLEYICLPPNRLCEGQNGLIYCAKSWAKSSGQAYFTYL